jgi:hypothetical protein
MHIVLAAGILGAAPPPPSRVDYPAIVQAADAPTGQTQDALAVLDAQIQSALLLSQLIWSTSQEARFIKGVQSVYPENAGKFDQVAARLQSDITVYTELYSGLILQIANGPARLNVGAQIDQAGEDLGGNGIVLLRRFLPVLRNHIEQVEFGHAGSNESRLSDILAVSPTK